MTCCFIGHRKIQDKAAVQEKVKEVVEDLIAEQGVGTFHFGSRSEFDDICHAVVTEFQKNHPDIVRVNYNCKSEYVVKKAERERLEKIESAVLKKEVRLKATSEEKYPIRYIAQGKRPTWREMKK